MIWKAEIANCHTSELRTQFKTVFVTGPGTIAEAIEKVEKTKKFEQMARDHGTAVILSYVFVGGVDR